MSIAASTARQPLVLMVDDEAVSRTLLAHYLRKTGHRALVAESAAAARRLVAELEPAVIDCVITDYNMPGESGLELLLWLKQNDPTLAVIMITATTEREFVTATLRGGASDLIDKPITEAKLIPALAAAIAATAHHRRLAATVRAVQDVGKTQHQISSLGPAATANLDVCYHPCHAAGGDFINFFPLGPGTFLVLAGDVAGHDLPAAFVSAYFQGMARGMVESGQPIGRVLACFNRFLLEEWGRHTVGAAATVLPSVCACAVLVDRTQRTATLNNHGIPRVWQIGADGRITPDPGPVEGPLGWFDDLSVAPTTLAVPEGGQLWAWTDGLEDLAETLDVHPCALAAGLLRAQLRGEKLAELAEARDDVLAVRIHLSAADGGAWLPVLHESYPGDRAAGINTFQTRWERSLLLALPELSDSRCYDVLLALRETMINALRHGCRGQPDQRGTLSIMIQPSRHWLRCIVEDPGPGHAYDWLGQHQTEELADLHRGLAMIHRLATRVTSARDGAELTLDFTY